MISKSVQILKNVTTNQRTFLIPTRRSMSTNKAINKQKHTIIFILDAKISHVGQNDITT